MPYLRTLLLQILFICLLSIPALAVEKTSLGGCDFSIQRVEFGSSQAEPKEYLSVAYYFTNNNEDQKIDFSGNLKFTLTDEFGNKYRALGKPDDYSRPALFTPRNFPSIYPGERYGETLFFEPPLAKASLLNLKIEAPFIGPGGSVDLTVDLEGLRRPKETAPAGNKEAGFFSPPPHGQSAAVKIAFPEPGHVYQQGDLIHLKTVVSGPDTPKRMILTAFEHTLEDNNPGKENFYDIVVPAEAPPGNFIINVIAQWPDDSFHEVSSDNVMVLIQRDSLLDIY
jgi:hypothetical protein